MTTLYLSGGRDAAKCACSVLPVLLATLKTAGSEGHTSLRLQSLRTLSEIAQASRRARHTLRQDDESLCMLTELVADVTHVRECRWACYIFSILVIGNVAMLQRLRGKPGFVGGGEGVCRNGGRFTIIQITYMYTQVHIQLYNVIT